MKSESFLTLHRHNANEMFKAQKGSKDIVKIVEATRIPFCAKKIKIIYSTISSLSCQSPPRVQESKDNYNGNYISIHTNA